MMGKEYRSLSSSLCSYFRSVVTSSLLSPNILLDTLFSNTIGLRSSLNVRDQVSHPYKITGWIIISDRYTGCPRRNVPDLGRVFLMLKYTDLTQNTYVQSGTGREIMAREV